MYLVLKGKNWVKKPRIDFIQSLMVSKSEKSCVDLAYNGIYEHMKKYSDIICMKPSPNILIPNIKIKKVSMYIMACIFWGK